MLTLLSHENTIFPLNHQRSSKKLNESSMFQVFPKRNHNFFCSCMVMYFMFIVKTVNKMYEDAYFIELFNNLSDKSVIHVS